MIYVIETNTTIVYEAKNGEDENAVRAHVQDMIDKGELFPIGKIVSVTAPKREGE